MDERGDAPGIAVRRAGLDDAPAIASVLYTAFVPYQALYTPGGFAATTPGADVIAGRLAEGPAWVALLAGEMVGTVAAAPHGTGLYVRSMAVLPTATGQGIGRRLLDDLERFAIAQGYPHLFLSTTPFLIPAIRLYEQWGFQRTADGPHDLHGTPLFTMVKPLVSADESTHP